MLGPMKPFSNLGNGELQHYWALKYLKILVSILCWRFTVLFIFRQWTLDIIVLSCWLSCLF